MKKRILCYGDSNTWGYTPLTGERYDDNTRWTRVCQRLLGDDYEILEDGLNGRTTVYDRPWAAYRNGLSSLGYSLLAQMPLDMVVVFLGTNDLPMVPMTRVVSGIDELLRHVVYADQIYGGDRRIFRDGAKVLLIAPMPYHPVVDTMPDSPDCGKYRPSLDFARCFRPVAEKYGVAFLDAGQYAGSSELDGIHLTPEGHRALGTAIAEKIKEMNADPTGNR